MTQTLPALQGVQSKSYVQIACSMFRAQTLLASMGAEVATVVHGDRGCGNIFKDHGVDARDQRFFSTMLSETDIVYGGERKLRAAIRQAAGDGARMVFVLGTCPSQLIGDDVAGICRVESDLLGVPVVPLDTMGMRWTNLFQVYEWIVGALVDRVMEQQERRARRINYVGYGMPHDSRPGRNLSALRDLLGAIGVEVGCVLPSGATLEEVRRAPDASLNVCRTRNFGEVAVQRMRDRFGTPWISPPTPIGVRHTGRFLREVAGALGIGAEAETTIVRLERGARGRIDDARAGIGRTLRAALQFFPECGNASVGNAYDVSSDVTMLADAGFEVTLYCLARPEMRDEIDAYVESALAEERVGVHVIYYAWPEALPKALERGRYDLALAPMSDMKYFRAAGYPTLEVPVRDGQKQPILGFDAAVMLTLDYLRAADSRFHAKYATYVRDAG